MDTKVWYMSKTVWAATLTTIIGILTMFKIIQIGPVQVENLAVESEGVSQGIVGLVEVILGLLALWGRLTAKTTLIR